MPRRGTRAPAFGLEIVLIPPSTPSARLAAKIRIGRSSATIGESEHRIGFLNQALNDIMGDEGEAARGEAARAPTSAAGAAPGEVGDPPES